MIHLVLVKFRGEWSLDLVEYDITVARKYKRELQKTNDKVACVSTDKSDPKYHQEIVDCYNKFM